MSELIPQWAANWAPTCGARTALLSAEDARERHAARLEFGSVGLMLGPGEDIDLLAPGNVGEAGERQNLAPFLLKEATGHSARPEFNVVLRVLGNRIMDDDVADLDPTAGTEHAPNLLHRAYLVRSQVDDAVADHDVD